jgi:hypothetical protein
MLFSPEALPPQITTRMAICPNRPLCCRKRPFAGHLDVVLRKEKCLSTLEFELEPTPSQMDAVRVEPAYPEIAFFDDIP